MSDVLQQMYKFIWLLKRRRRLNQRGVDNDKILLKFAIDRFQSANLAKNEVAGVKRFIWYNEREEPLEVTPSSERYRDEECNDTLNYYRGIVNGKQVLTTRHTHLVQFKET